MLSLDLFNTKYERDLREGAVDDVEARRIDALNDRMQDLLARAKEPAYRANPAALAGLKKQFQQVKDERDSYYKIREAGIPGNVPTEKIPGKEDLLKGKGRSYYEDQKKNSEQVDEYISMGSDKNYTEAEPYKNYRIYVRKKPFGTTGIYTAHTEIDRKEFMGKGPSQEEAVQAIKDRIDFVLNAQRKVTGSSTIDFNVKFATDLLADPRQTFYAKLENIDGKPKLVIAGAEVASDPELLAAGDFKRSALRNQVDDSGRATPLPGIPLTAKGLRSGDWIANGRYTVGKETQDRDGNRVFDLTYHSTAHTKSDKLRLNQPAFTLGTAREVDEEKGTGPLDQKLQRLKVQARRQFPRAHTDDEALILKMLDKETQDDRENRRVDARQDAELRKNFALDREQEDEIEDLQTQVSVREHGGGIGPRQHWQDLMPEQSNLKDDDWYDDEDQETELRSGDYVRDTMDGEYGEVFRMQGDPYERRVRILDRDGRGWYIEPSRLTRVDPTDPDVQRYFGKQRQRDMDEAIVASGPSQPLDDRAVRKLVWDTMKINADSGEQAIQRALSVLAKKPQSRMVQDLQDKFQNLADRLSQGVAEADETSWTANSAQFRKEEDMSWPVEVTLEPNADINQGRGRQVKTMTVTGQSRDAAKKKLVDYYRKNGWTVTGIKFTGDLDEARRVKGGDYQLKLVDQQSDDNTDLDDVVMDYYFDVYQNGQKIGTAEGDSYYGELVVKPDFDRQFKLSSFHDKDHPLMQQFEKIENGLAESATAPIIVPKRRAKEKKPTKFHIPHKASDYVPPAVALARDEEAKKKKGVAEGMDDDVEHLANVAADAYWSGKFGMTSATEKVKMARDIVQAVEDGRLSIEELRQDIRDLDNKGVAEGDDLGHLDAEVFGRIDKEKQRRADLKKNDPAAYAREMEKDKKNYGRGIMGALRRKYDQPLDEEDVAEGWSDAMVSRRTGTPRTPYSVYIKGKKWKDFATDDHARAVMDKLKAKFAADGRDPETITIAPSDYDQPIKEEQDTSGVESAIIRRIMVAHTDLLKQFGPDKVVNAIEEVAYNVGDVDEIGTSDVSAYVAQVKQILGATA